MSPTPRAALLLGAVAFAALVMPPPLVALGALAALSATVIDALAARTPPTVVRNVPSVLSRGVPASLAIEVATPGPRAVRIRQAGQPDLHVEKQEGENGLESTVLARRRGRHVLPAVAARTEGPIGLGCWYHRIGEDQEVTVYPDVPAARKLAVSAREGRFREPGLLGRGPLGLGTDFESIREYLPDDDIRQVNWRATARLGRPMSNQYRVEQDREVLCVVDTGRLMAAPLGDRTRLDSTLDAVTAVAFVADAVGDHCGAIAFDSRIRRQLPPRRGGADGVIRALYDLEPTDIDSDYELAFRAVGGTKRAFVLVLTDLLEEAAARPLVDAVPVLSRRHFVVVASASDTDLNRGVSKVPMSLHDVYASSVALEVLDARARVASLLRGAGAEVVEAAPVHLGAACVGAYLRAKARARL